MPIVKYYTAQVCLAQGIAVITINPFAYDLAIGTIRHHIAKSIGQSLAATAGAGAKPLLRSVNTVWL